MEVLSKHLETFRCCPEGGEEEGEGVASSSVSVAASGIVLYREAIEHCARLYRIMVSMVEWKPLNLFCCPF